MKASAETVGQLPFHQEDRVTVPLRPCGHGRVETSTVTRFLRPSLPPGFDPTPIQERTGGRTASRTSPVGAFNVTEVDW